jgi:TolA-binding protein
MGVMFRLPLWVCFVLLLATANHGCISTRSDMLREINADMDRIQNQLNQNQTQRQQLAEERKRVLEKMNSRLNEEDSYSQPVPPAPTQSAPVMEAPITTTDNNESATMTDSQASTAFRRAQAFYNRGEYNDAAEEYVLAYRYARDENMKARSLYWLGESYYRLRDWQRAISCFDKFEEEFPEHKLSPAALLKKGYSLLQDGQAVSGRATLQILIDLYPQSAEAPLAQQRLNSLE